MPVDEIRKVVINAIENKSEFNYPPFINNKLVTFINNKLVTLINSKLEMGDDDDDDEKKGNSKLEMGYDYDDDDDDEKRAFRLIKKLAMNGNFKAQNNLGNLYYNGVGTEEDLEKAFYCYQKAAENGNEIAMYNLGNLYYNGKGTEENLEKAFEWYHKAAKNDNKEAQHNLGNLYYNGNGTEKNSKKAFELYQEAAENGNENSMYSLGNLYDRGEGTKKDSVKASYWYQKARENGFKEPLTPPSTFQTTQAVNSAQKKSPIVETKKKEEMKIIISTQEKEGSFILIDVIRMKIDISSSETIPIAVKKFIKSEKLREIDNSKLFNTAVTIAYLRLILFDYNSQWENNIEQARKYIKEQINDEDLEDEILKASENLVKFFYKDST